MRIGLVLAGLTLSGSAVALDALPPAAQEPTAKTAASSQPLVRVLLRGCKGFTEAEVERVLAAELAADSGPRGGAREPTWVVVHCAARTVVLEVHDPRSDETLQRRFDFPESGPKARARLIAIAAAELVLASSAERIQAPEPPVGAEKSPEADTPPLERRAPAAKPDSANGPTLLLGSDPTAAREGVGPRGERIIYGDYVWERLPSRTVYRIAALSTARAFLDRRGVFAGGGLRFGSDLHPLHCWSVDALVETGMVYLGDGVPLSIESWTLGGSLGWLAELEGRLTVRGGAGLRAGLLRRQGRAASGSQFGWPAFWGWPTVTLGTSIRLGRVMVELGSEAGYAALPVGPGTNVASVRGFWLSGELGLGMRL